MYVQLAFQIKKPDILTMVYQEGQKHRYGSTRISKIRADP